LIHNKYNMPKKNTLTKRLTKLEREARPEVKFVQGQSGAFDTVGSITGTLLTPMSLATGSARNQRVGDKIKSRNIRVQGIIKMPQNPASPTCAVRVLVLRAKYSTPQASDMPDWYAPVDEDRFFVLRDFLTQVSAVQARTVTGTSFETGSTLKKFKLNIPIGLRKMQYDGIADQRPLNNEVVVYILAENQSAEMAYNWTHYYLDN